MRFDLREARTAKESDIIRVGVLLHSNHLLAPSVSPHQSGWSWEQSRRVSRKKTAEAKTVNRRCRQLGHDMMRGHQAASRVSPEADIAQDGCVRHEGDEDGPAIEIRL